MLKVLALLKEQEKQIIEYGAIHSNTVMLMNIKQCIKELEQIDKLEKRINLSPYDIYDTVDVYLVSDINEVIKG